MRVTCQIDKGLPGFVKDVIHDRTAEKLSRFGDFIREIHVTLRDINGPRGGIDMECQVRVRLRRHPEVIVTERASRVDEATSGALNRVARSIGRRLAQQARRVRMGSHRERLRAV